MATFISRDYNLGVTGYISQPFGGSWSGASITRFHVGYMYQLTIFLQKILGFSVVGQTSWDINNTNIKSVAITAAASPSTTIAAGSNGLSLPQSTINVASTTNFTSTGTIYVTTSVGAQQAVTYTGITATSFTGCTGGTGTMSTGGAITTPQITASTAAAHGLIDGYVVSITGGTGNAGVNGTWRVLVINSTQFGLYGSYNTGSYTASSATMTSGFLYASGAVVDGYGAGINFGAGALTEVSIPISKRTVVAGDVGKMLVLKSNAFTTKNSGIFKITGINAGANRYIVDYRATEPPPAELTNSIDWWLYESESIASGYLSKYNGGALNISSSTNATPIQITSDTNFPHTWVTGQKVLISSHTTNTNANGIWTITQVSSTQFTLNGSTGNGVGSGGTVTLVGYPANLASGGVAANSRIILQSPHSSGWQVRLAAEPISANLAPISITMGYGGTSTGDFPPSSNITNVAQYLDINPASNTSYNNLMVGAGNPNVPTTQRISMIGDGYGQSVVVYSRNTGTGTNGILVFGIPSNEPVPTPSDADRIFCYGSAQTADFGSIILRTGSTLNVGNSIKRGNIDLAALTGWANLDGTSATSPLRSANAADSPFTGTTEILPIEVWSGINGDIGLTGSATPLIFYDPIFMGTAQFLRNGRTNFGDFTLTSDDVTVRNISAATNATPIQITTSTTNGLVTGQTVTIYGVTGNTAANGTFTVTVLNSTQFTLDGSVGNGAFTGQFTTIAAGSNGVALPTGTINVVDTTGFPASGTIYVTTSTGVSTVNYTSTNATQFLGCTGGTGTMSTNNGVSTSVVNGCPQWLHLQNGIFLRWDGSFGITA